MAIATHVAPTKGHTKIKIKDKIKSSRLKPLLQRRRQANLPKVKKPFIKCHYLRQPESR